MKFVFLIALLFCQIIGRSQQGFAFTRITTDDGMGLASNVVSSLHQDARGFIWVGTANGLQRFDGSKFIQFGTEKRGSDLLPHSGVSQIIPIGKSHLILSFPSLREFGLFNTSTYSYQKIAFHLDKPLPARAEFWMWNDSHGDVYLNVLRYGMLRFDRVTKAFINSRSFGIPAGWQVSLAGIHEDVKLKQYWFACDSGLVIYDRPSGQTFTRDNNPKQLPVLKHKELRERLTEVYLDKQRRIWVFGWPLAKNGVQDKYCLDPTGSKFLHADTAGINMGPVGYTEYRHFYETKEGDLWIYGNGVLFNFDKLNRRFIYTKNEAESESVGISYGVVHQMIGDRDGNIWLATDQGLYFTVHGDGVFSVVNLRFSNRTETTSITDILELPNGDLWFSSWGSGIKSIDRLMNKKQNYVYEQPPPGSWNEVLRAATRLPWSMTRQTGTGKIWIGCNMGVLMIHDPATKQTQYLHPDELANSTVRFITEDQKGQMWLGTQSGRLLKWTNNEMQVVMDFGTIIYKLFFDRQGWLWIATHEKGLYAINPASGELIQHYTAGTSKSRLFSNTGNDIEQLNDSIIVFGAGALNFINKNNGHVRLLTYEEGLLSNNVSRLRMDKNGFLWIITSNGLCRYNPRNNRITPYGRKDGIVLAEQASESDYVSQDNYLLFAGSNAVIMFNPDVFLNTAPPPDVTITDFKVFNDYLPVDSLLMFPQVSLKPDQNSFSIYFSSLSYMQRDKLTYYYKLEGVDNSWIKADRSFFVNYSLLPPGKYTFSIYCESLEGLRSLNTTRVMIYIKPPFWRTYWFYTSLLFIVALLAYAIHDMRVNKLLAVEQIRNRVARDLHDDMGSTLSTINILSSMAKTKMTTDAVKTAEYLSKISDNSQRMMEAMDDIVWSIKPTNDSMQKIIARMREFATSVLEAKDIELQFTTDEDVYDVKLNMEARRDFFLVFKEAVNNAAKYSHASRVTVKLALKNKKLTMLVEDNGKGFDVPKADGGNGLGNMQKRAEAMNGTIDIESRPGNGTQVKVSIFVD
ncbi:hypothetical protein EXU57_06200 [Segetibacter sp. 3557_3]|uniref:ligand-binding sensor domain-containing protein n=1 Tax=Segetibacter sp. 3557_3 TaxID=2547429 RepID=UPI0010587B57|nr:sensor histidine kinase [Segetibacter sp. 3557_3]TDH28051.1 hypothetical protein EXU57_06200 [Segetibacter sp. 3557_3]